MRKGHSVAIKMGSNLETEAGGEENRQQIPCLLVEQLKLGLP